jgi:hypothetical protein
VVAANSLLYPGLAGALTLEFRLTNDEVRLAGYSQRGARRHCGGVSCIHDTYT